MFQNPFEDIKESIFGVFTTTATYTDTTWEMPSYKEKLTQQIEVISYFNFSDSKKTFNMLSMPSSLPSVSKHLRITGWIFPQTLRYIRVELTCGKLFRNSQARCHKTQQIFQGWIHLNSDIHSAGKCAQGSWLYFLSTMC